MEHEVPPYRLTIGDIGACFQKTPGKLIPVLQHLVEKDLLSIHGRLLSTDEAAGVFPTASALRTLAAFRDETDSALEVELSKLHEPT